MHVTSIGSDGHILNVLDCTKSSHGKKENKNCLLRCENVEDIVPASAIKHPIQAQS